MTPGIRLKMKSALLLLSGLAATCLSAAVPVAQPDALLPREKGTVTVVVTITSTTTRSSSTPKSSTGSIVYVTITSTVTKSSSTHPITTAAPTGPWGPWNSGRPPWWSSWLTQGNPVTVTASLGPVTVYSPIYITVTETDTDDNLDATVTLPVLTLGAPGAKREEALTDWGPWHHSSVTTIYVNPPKPTTSTIYVIPPQPISSVITITEYITVTPTVSQSSETARITFYPPRNAAPEAEAEPQIFSIGPVISRTVQESPTPPLPPWWHWWPISTPTATPLPWIIGREVQEKRQVLGSPTRTVQESPTPPPFPPWWWWPPHTADETTEKDKREPQVLGSPTRTVQQSPTPPPFPPWWWWPPHTADETVARDVNKKREPQVLGSPTRTVQQSPTPPPFPPWWWWPPAAADETTEKEKREPQALGSPSRTVQASPTPPLPPWWIWWPPASSDETIDREVNEKREPQTLGSPSRTAQAGPTPPWWIWWPVQTPNGERTVNEKREPQTLVLGSRTVNAGPPPEITAHHSSHKYTSGTPYIIEATATLPMVTLGKREPQTLGFPSRTNEITPGRPPRSTSVSTVYVTVTEIPYVSTSKPHHHPSTFTTITTIVYSPTDDYSTPSPTGTEIDSTVTLPFVINTPTPLAKEKRDPEAQSLTLSWQTTASFPPHSTGKENPCQNNIFAPPAWCFTTPTIRTSTVTITYTGTVIEGTGTLPPWTVYEPTSWWGSRRKQRKQRQELGTQTRTFTYAPETTSPP